MITLTFVYWVAGIAFVAFSLLSARDTTNPRRFINAAFWALIALSMFAGDYLGDLGNGILVLALVAMAGIGKGLGRGTGESNPAFRVAQGKLHGNKLFLLALVIPATALIGTIGVKYGVAILPQIPDYIDSKQVTLISLAMGVLIALVIAMAWLKPKPVTPFEEGRRLMDSVGWASVLPQMLASLGAVFALAGVGDVVGGLMTQVIPEGSLFGAVLAFGLGMALFTMVMGNAFAAFPVMATAIALPLLINDYGGNPAIICAIGMLAGFCGTLMTPMAANFNIVPAALLELKDRNAVVKMQVGTAVPLLIVNIALIYFLAF